MKKFVFGALHSGQAAAAESYQIQLRSTDIAFRATTGNEIFPQHAYVAQQPSSYSNRQVVKDIDTRVQ